MTNFRPLYNRLLVRRNEGASSTAGGLIIPEQAKERPQTAYVVAVGDGYRSPDGTLRPLCVKAGDTILFGKYNGETLVIDGIEHTVLKEEEVFAIVSGA